MGYTVMWYICSYKSGEDIAKVINEETLELRPMGKFELLKLMLNGEFKSCTGSDSIVCSNNTLDGIKDMVEKKSFLRIAVVDMPCNWDLETREYIIVINIGILADWRKTRYELKNKGFYLYPNYVMYNNKAVKLHQFARMHGVYVEDGELKLVYSTREGFTRAVSYWFYTETWMCECFDCTLTQLMRLALL